jgi:hypothetical protein
MVERHPLSPAARAGIGAVNSETRLPIKYRRDKAPCSYPQTSFEINCSIVSST